MWHDDELQRRLDCIEREVSARLRPLCEHFPPELFDQMVYRIALTELKYRLSPGDRGRADALIGRPPLGDMTPHQGDQRP